MVAEMPDLRGDESSHPVPFSGRGTVCRPEGLHLLEFPDDPLASDFEGFRDRLAAARAVLGEVVDDAFGEWRDGWSEPHRAGLVVPVEDVDHGVAGLLVAVLCLDGDDAVVVSRLNASRLSQTDSRSLEPRMCSPWWPVW